MPKLIDLKGRCFGEWTVLERSTPTGKTGHSYWLCICTCGTKTQVNGFDLRSGRSQRCLRCRFKKQRGAKHPINPVFSHVKGNAIKRGLAFEIDRDYAYSVFERQGMKCALTGLPLKIERSHGETYYSSCTASLDRIDPQKGYVVGNVQWVYKPINNMKWKLQEDEFIRLCRLVIQTADSRLASA